MNRTLSATLVLAALGLSGCPGSHTNVDVDAGSDAAIERADVGVGADAGTEDSAAPASDANVDAGARPDGGPVIPTCEPMNAGLDVCAGGCFGITSAFWDGASCVAAHCDCVGPDCDVYASVEACEADHATCEATLCAATGGAWFNRLEWCGNFACGTPGDEVCFAPTRACDCGTYRIFAPGVGCVDGPLCELRAPIEPDALCRETGGDWMLGICGHATCGRLSDLDCASPGCVCGALEVFDADRGCIRSPACEERDLGESCDATGLCRDGNVCCATGGASAARFCGAPVCGDPSGPCGPPRP